MVPQFNELMKEVRATSLWPHPYDFAKAVGMSRGGYLKIESGERLPTEGSLKKIIEYGQLSPEQVKQLEETWRHAKAKQAGIPAGSAPASINKILNQLENEIIVVLRQYAPSANPVARQIATILKKRAEVILRTALET